MSINIKDYPALERLLSFLTGMPWPEGDEDLMHAVGEDYLVVAQTLPKVADELRQLSAWILAEFKGESATAFGSSISELIGGSGGDDAFSSAAKSMAQLSDYAHQTANQIEYAKLMILAMLEDLLINTINAYFWAPFQPELLFELALDYIFTREGIEALLWWLLKTIAKETFQQVMSGLRLDLGVQLIQILEGHRSGIDGSLTLQSVEGGVVGGLMSPFLHGAQKGLGDALGALMGKGGAAQLGKDLGNELGHALEDGVQDITHEVANDVAHDVTQQITEDVTHDAGAIGRLTADQSASFQQDLARLMNRTPAEFARTGAGSIAQRFETRMGQLFEKHLAPLFAGDEAAARLFGEEFAATFAKDWARGGDHTELSGALRNVLESRGVLNGEAVHTLAESLPHLMDHLGAHDGGVAFAAGHFLIEQGVMGAQNYLSGGLVSLIFGTDGVHDWSGANVDSIYSGMLMGVAGKLMHHALSPIGNAWGVAVHAFMQRWRNDPDHYDARKYFGPDTPLFWISVISNLAGYNAPFPPPRLTAHGGPMTAPELLKGHDRNEVKETVERLLPDEHPAPVGGGEARKVVSEEPDFGAGDRGPQLAPPESVGDNGRPSTESGGEVIPPAEPRAIASAGRHHPSPDNGDDDEIAPPVESSQVMGVGGMNVAPHPLDRPTRIDGATADPFPEMSAKWHELSKQREELAILRARHHDALTEADVARIGELTRGIPRRQGNLRSEFSRFLSATDEGLRAGVDRRVAEIAALRDQLGSLDSSQDASWRIEHTRQRLEHLEAELVDLQVEQGRRELYGVPSQLMVPSARDLLLVVDLKDQPGAGARLDERIVRAQRLVDGKPDNPLYRLDLKRAQDDRALYEQLEGRTDWSELSDAQAAALVVVERKSIEFESRERALLIANLREAKGEAWAWAKNYPVSSDTEVSALLDRVHEHMRRGLGVATNFHLDRAPNENRNLGPGGGRRDSLLALLMNDKDQLFRNTWETGASQAAVDDSRRGSVEEHFGLAAALGRDPRTREHFQDTESRNSAFKPADPGGLPKYAGLVSRYQTDGVARRYGASVLHWDSAVRGRSTHTPRDSWTASEMGARSVTADSHPDPLLNYGDAHLVRLAFGEATDFAYDREFGEQVKKSGLSTQSYFETQIHGPLSWTDLKRITVNHLREDHQGPNPDELPTAERALELKRTLEEHARLKGYTYTVELRYHDAPPGGAHPDNHGDLLDDAKVSSHQLTDTEGRAFGRAVFTPDDLAIREGLYRKFKDLTEYEQRDEWDKGTGKWVKVPWGKNIYVFADHHGALGFDLGGRRVSGSRLGGFLKRRPSLVELRESEESAEIVLLGCESAAHAQAVADATGMVVHAPTGRTGMVGKDVNDPFNPDQGAVLYVRRSTGDEDGVFKTFRPGSARAQEETVHPLDESVHPVDTGVSPDNTNDGELPVTEMKVAQHPLDHLPFAEDGSLRDPYADTAEKWNDLALKREELAGLKERQSGGEVLSTEDTARGARLERELRAGSELSPAFKRFLNGADESLETAVRLRDDEVLALRSGLERLRADGDPQWRIDHAQARLDHTESELLELHGVLSRRDFGDLPAQSVIPGPRDVELAKLLRQSEDARAHLDDLVVKAQSLVGKEPDSRLAELELKRAQADRALYEELRSRNDWADLAPAQVAALVVVKRKALQFAVRERALLVAKLQSPPAGKDWEWLRRYPVGSTAEVEALLAKAYDHLHEKWSVATNLDLDRPPGANRQIDLGGTGRRRSSPGLDRLRLSGRKAREPVVERSLLNLLIADRDQQFRNSWETGKSQAAVVESRRGGVEEHFGYGSTLRRDSATKDLFQNTQTKDSVFHPEEPGALVKYAALVSRFQPHGVATRYGAFVMHWDDAIRGRVTYTPKDSWETGPMGARSVTTDDHLDPLLNYGDAYQIRLILGEATDFAHDPEFGESVKRHGLPTESYFEAQVHGPLRWADLKKVTINHLHEGRTDTTGQGLPTFERARELKAELEQHAIDKGYGFTVELRHHDDPPMGAPGRTESSAPAHALRPYHGLSPDNGPAEDHGLPALRVTLPSGRVLGGRESRANASARELLDVVTRMKGLGLLSPADERTLKDSLEPAASKEVRREQVEVPAEVERLVLDLVDGARVEPLGPRQLAELDVPVSDSVGVGGRNHPDDVAKVREYLDRHDVLGVADTPERLVEQLVVHHISGTFEDRPGQPARAGRRVSSMLDELAARNATMAWINSGRDGTTDFASWARAGAPKDTAPPLGEATSANCWEAIMLAGFHKNALSSEWIAQTYASELKGVKWQQWLIGRLLPYSRTEFVRGEREPKPGQLVVVGHTGDHVALVVGDRGSDGSAKVVGLGWTSELFGNEDPDRIAHASLAEIGWPVHFGEGPFTIPDNGHLDRGEALSHQLTDSSGRAFGRAVFTKKELAIRDDLYRKLPDLPDYVQWDGSGKSTGKAVPVPWGKNIYVLADHHGAHGFYLGGPPVEGRALGGFLNRRPSLVELREREKSAEIVLLGCESAARAQAVADATGMVVHAPTGRTGMVSGDPDDQFNPDRGAVLYVRPDADGKPGAFKTFHPREAGSENLYDGPVHVLDKLVHPLDTTGAGLPSDNSPPTLPVTEMTVAQHPLDRSSEVADGGPAEDPFPESRRSKFIRFLSAKDEVLEGGLGLREKEIASLQEQLGSLKIGRDAPSRIDDVRTRLEHLEAETVELQAELSRREFGSLPSQSMIPSPRDVELVHDLQHPETAADHLREKQENARALAASDPDNPLVALELKRAEADRALYESLSSRTDWKALKPSQVAALVVVERKSLAFRARERTLLVAKVRDPKGKEWEWLRNYPVASDEELDALLNEVDRHMHHTMRIATNLHLDRPLNANRQLVLGTGERRRSSLLGLGGRKSSGSRQPEAQSETLLDLLLRDPGQLFRNTWETGASQAAIAESRRGGVEEHMGFSPVLRRDSATRELFQNTETEDSRFGPEHPEELPKYGALVSPYQPRGVATRYGSFVLHWNDAIRGRVTHTPRDSWTAGQMGARSVTSDAHLDPLLNYGDAHQVRLAFAEATGFAYDQAFGESVKAKGMVTESYFETQIHGSLHWLDLKTITINHLHEGEPARPKEGLPSIERAQALKARLEEHARKNGYLFTVELRHHDDPPAPATHHETSTASHEAGPENGVELPPLEVKLPSGGLLGAGIKANSARELLELINRMRNLDVLSDDDAKPLRAVLQSVYDRDRERKADESAPIGALKGKPSLPGPVPVEVARTLLAHIEQARRTKLNPEFWADQELHLTDTVGAGGANRAQDVEAVREFLRGQKLPHVADEPEELAAQLTTHFISGGMDELPGKPELAGRQVSMRLNELSGSTMAWDASGQDGDTMFARWAREGADPTKAPRLEETTTANCWETILLAGFHEGVLDSDWIKETYQATDTGGRPWNEWLVYRLLPYSRSEFIPGVKEPKVGQLVILGKDAQHVAIVVDEHGPDGVPIVLGLGWTSTLYKNDNENRIAPASLHDMGGGSGRVFFGKGPFKVRRGPENGPGGPDDGSAVQTRRLMLSDGRSFGRGSFEEGAWGDRKLYKDLPLFRWFEQRQEWKEPTGRFQKVPWAEDDHVYFFASHADAAGFRAVLEGGREKQLDGQGLGGLLKRFPSFEDLRQASDEQTAQGGSEPRGKASLVLLSCESAAHAQAVADETGMTVHAPTGTTGVVSTNPKDWKDEHSTGVLFVRPGPGRSPGVFRTFKPRPPQSAETGTPVPANHRTEGASGDGPENTPPGDGATRQVRLPSGGQLGAEGRGNNVPGEILGLLKRMDTLGLDTAKVAGLRGELTALDAVNREKEATFVQPLTGKRPVAPKEMSPESVQSIVELFADALSKPLLPEQAAKLGVQLSGPVVPGEANHPKDVEAVREYLRSKDLDRPDSELDPVQQLVSGYLSGELEPVAVAGRRVSAQLEALSEAGQTMRWQPSKLDGETDFAVWARSGAPADQAPALSEETSANCFEAVMLAGYHAGVLPGEWIAETYAIPKDVSYPKALSNFLPKLVDRLMPDRETRREWTEGGPVPRKGSVVVQGKGNHVAVATGTFGKDGTPDTVGLGVEGDDTDPDEISKTTFDQLSRTGNGPIYYATPPWQPDVHPLEDSGTPENSARPSGSAARTLYPGTARENLTDAQRRVMETSVRTAELLRLRVDGRGGRESLAAVGGLVKFLSQDGRSDISAERLATLVRASHRLGRTATVTPAMLSAVTEHAATLRGLGLRLTAKNVNGLRAVTALAGRVYGKDGVEGLDRLARGVLGQVKDGLVPAAELVKVAAVLHPAGELTLPELREAAHGAGRWAASEPAAAGPATQPVKAPEKEPVESAKEPAAPDPQPADLLGTVEQLGLPKDHATLTAVRRVFDAAGAKDRTEDRFNFIVKRALDLDPFRVVRDHHRADLLRLVAFHDGLLPSRGLTVRGLRALHALEQLASTDDRDWRSASESENREMLKGLAEQVFGPSADPDRQVARLLDVALDPYVRPERISVDELRKAGAASGENDGRGFLQVGGDEQQATSSASSAPGGKLLASDGTAIRDEQVSGQKLYGLSGRGIGRVIVPERMNPSGGALSHLEEISSVQQRVEALVPTGENGKVPWDPKHAYFTVAHAGRAGLRLPTELGEKRVSGAQFGAHLARRASVVALKKEAARQGRKPTLVLLGCDAATVARDVAAASGMRVFAPTRKTGVAWNQESLDASGHPTLYLLKGHDGSDGRFEEFEPDGVLAESFNAAPSGYHPGAGPEGRDLHGVPGSEELVHGMPLGEDESEPAGRAFLSPADWDRLDPAIYGFDPTVREYAKVTVDTGAHPGEAGYVTADHGTVEVPWPAGHRPYFVLGSGSGDEVFLTTGQVGRKAVRWSDFAELIAGDPALAKLDPEAPVVLLVPQSGLDLAHEVADLTGRPVYAMTGDHAFLPKPGGRWSPAVRVPEGGEAGAVGSGFVRVDPAVRRGEALELGVAPVHRVDTWETSEPPASSRDEQLAPSAGPGRADGAERRAVVQHIPEEVMTEIASKVVTAQASESFAEHVMGMPPRIQRAFQAFVDRTGLVVEVRPTNPDSVPHMADALPKPEEMKAKTVNRLDVHLGAAPETVGLVGFFEPKLPARTGELTDPKLWAAVEKRYEERAEEQRVLSAKMTERPEGRFRVRDGLVQGKDEQGNWRRITGDHDVFDVHTVDGVRLDPESYREVVEAMLAERVEGGARLIQHGAHRYWEPTGEFDKLIHQEIMNTHMAKEGEPSDRALLLRFLPGAERPLVVRAQEEESTPDGGLSLGPFGGDPGRHIRKLGGTPQHWVMDHTPNPTAEDIFDVLSG